MPGVKNSVHNLHHKHTLLHRETTYSTYISKVLERPFKILPPTLDTHADLRSSASACASVRLSPRPCVCVCVRASESVSVRPRPRPCAFVRVRVRVSVYIPYCDYLIRVLFNANFAKTRKIALLNTRNNNAFTT